MTLEAAYIVPHPPLAVKEIGRGDERVIADTLNAYHEIARRIAAHKPTTILFVSPHSAYYADWIYLAAGKKAQGSFKEFAAPQLVFELSYDEGWRDALISEAQADAIPAGILSHVPRKLDHGVMVPLYFIGQELKTDAYQAVSIGGSGLPVSSLLAFGRCITRAAEKQEGVSVLVVSGDLSHKLKEEGPYGFDPAGPRFDRAFAEVVQSGNPLGFAAIDPSIREPAAECGLSGCIMLAGALDERKKSEDVSFTSELLSLEGPFGVGYGVAAFECSKKQASSE